MSITVKEAMKIGGLQKCKVIAGEKGLDRKIDHVIVMEIPDIVEWLNGNDFLLTSLFPIKDDEKAIGELVSRMHHSGSAVLAVKNRFFDKFPEEIISEANRLNLPVIEIKKEIAFVDIITPLMKEILHEGSLNQNNIEEFFKWITELALGGKGIPALVQAVESFVGNPLSIESEIPLIMEIKKQKAEKLNLKQKKEIISSKRPVRMTRKINGTSVSTIVAPILLNGESYGYITCWEVNRKFRMIDLVVVERLVSLFALEFLKIKTKFDVEQEYKNDFLYEVLIGRINNKHELIEKARVFNWDLSLDYQVVVLDIDNFSSVVEELQSDELRVKEFKNKILGKIEKIVAKDSIVILASDKIIILYPSINREDQIFKDFLIQLQKKVKRDIKEVTFTMGVGRLYPGIDGIHHGFEEALKAIQIGRMFWGKDQVVNFDDLGIYRLLTQVRDKKELERFCDETISILIDYDKKNNSNLVCTLTEYFNQNYSALETAKKLFIHVNTLKYRLEKIEHLTSLAINNAEDRLKLHLGLKIINIL